jgi:hypothetical protein
VRFNSRTALSRDLRILIIMVSQEWIICFFGTIALTTGASLALQIRNWLSLSTADTRRMFAY